MILVVDDHPDTARALARLLRFEGFEASVRHCGAELLRHLSGPPPRLVILDVMMPDLSGLDCLRAIRNHLAWRDVPVILYTADASYETLRDARAAGAQEVLVKSKTPWADVLAAIHQHAAV